MRAFAVVAAQARASLLVAVQYRADFAIDAVVEVVWTSTILAPLFVLAERGRGVAGWSFDEALVVVAFFTLLQAVLEGVLHPSFSAVVEHARRGSLDHLLVKPVDPQLLLSTCRMLPWRAVNLVTAGVLLILAFARRGTWPTFSEVARCALACAAALTTLYALFTFGLATAFVWIRAEGVADLLSGVLDGARFPSSVYRGALRVVFTFVIPFGVLTTFPAEALLGRLTAPALAVAVAEAAAFLLAARLCFARALRAYRSASS